MYMPDHFMEPDVARLHRLIRLRPLATLVTMTSGGLNANPVPLVLSTDCGQFGVLRGHVARSNPIWRDFSCDCEAMAIFHGPEAYVSPSWYPTKAETGRAVPTWNYVLAQAYGSLCMVDDPVWLKAQLESLTHQSEASFPAPWNLGDAPPGYLEGMLRSIVGIEIVITSLTGKFKLSQNQPERNREGVVRGLRSLPAPGAQEMADWIEGSGFAWGVRSEQAVGAKESKVRSELRTQRLIPEQAAEYRSLMLEAYAACPEAFTSTVAERNARPLSWWASRLSEGDRPQEIVFGVFVEDRLAGVVGLDFETREKTRHKASLFGMYVREPFRQLGLGRLLVDAALNYARSREGVGLVQLTVTEGNRLAEDLYIRCGFVRFGREPCAVAAGSRYLAKIHMACMLRPFSQ